MACVLLCLPAVSFGQEKTLTLNVRNVSATEVFNRIEQQTGYKFFYKTEQINQLQNITLRVSDAPLHEVLDKVFEGSRFSYEIAGEQIVVVERKAVAATDVEVSGVVKDAKGQPLPGVAVVVKGTTIGVSTNVDGRFVISTSPNNVLQFRFLGMKDVDMSIPENCHLDVVMEEAVEVIDEVVVTGYGNFKKSSYTGSASVLSTGQLQSLPVVSVTQMLEANVPGISLSSSSGQPGSNVSMRVRGIGSFNASNEPLYILDGVPVTSGNLSSNSMNSGGLGFITTIPPSEIESVTILKDAASASLYGARGANGVVLITTRKGAQGKTTYNLKANFGVSDLAYTFREIMGGEERRELIYEGFVNQKLDEGLSQADAEAYADSQIDIYAAEPATGWADWEGALLKKGNQQNYDFSVRGGNASTRFAGSISYTKQDGVSYNSGFKRLGGHLNFSNSYKGFDFGMNALLTYTRQSAIPEGSYYSSAMYTSKLTLTPSDPIYNEDGTYNTNLSQNGNMNPLKEAEYNNYYTTVARTFATIDAAYNFLKGFKVATSFSVDYAYTKDFRYFSPLSKDGLVNNGQGDMWMVENIRYNSDSRLSYARSFGKHSLDALVSYEVSHWAHDDLFAEAKNYANSLNQTLANASTPVSVGQTKKGDAMLSFVSRLNYDYAKKYYLSLSLRWDGSSRLQRDHRWDNFWAVSGAWRISQEKFMSGLSNWLSDAKIRLSYGVNGNIPYLLYGYYGTYSTDWDYNNAPAIVEGALPNDELSWERNYAFNFGLDLYLFDRVSIAFDAYKRRTKDLLMDRQVNTMTGFSSVLDNVGELENKGFELDVKSVNIETKHFSWQTALNLSHNKNKVVKLADVDEFASDSYYVVKEGYSLGTIKLREYAGVDPENGKPMYYSNVEDENGVRSREIVYDPNDAVSIPLKCIHPKLRGGFANTFHYWLVDFSFNLSFTLGGYSYDGSMPSLQNDGYNATRNKSTELRRRWKKPGDVTDVPRYVNGQEFGGWWHSSRGIHSTDHLRLKSLILGVSAPRKWLDAIGFSQARIYFSGTNLLTWAAYKQYDPEMNRTVSLGVPPLKTWAFGIEIGI